MARYEPYRPVETVSPAAQALLTYVRANDFVTYAEMARVLAPLIPVNGPLAAAVGTVPTLILWAGMSQEWVDVLHELFRAGVLWRDPCAFLTSLMDGACLTMPIAKRPSKQGSATPIGHRRVCAPLSILPHARASDTGLRLRCPLQCSRERRPRDSSAPALPSSCVGETHGPDKTSG
jgi:hypothetical protein